MHRQLNKPFGLFVFVSVRLKTVMVQHSCLICENPKPVHLLIILVTFLVELLNTSEEIQLISSFCGQFDGFDSRLGTAVQQP